MNTDPTCAFTPKCKNPIDTPFRNTSKSSSITAFELHTSITSLCPVQSRGGLGVVVVFGFGVVVVFGFGVVVVVFGFGVVVVCVIQSQPPGTDGFITIITSASLQYAGGQQLQLQLQKPPFPVIGNGPWQEYVAGLAVVVVVVVVVSVGLIVVVGLVVVLSNDLLIDFSIVLTGFGVVLLSDFLIGFLIDFLIILVGLGVVALAIDISFGFSGGLSNGLSVVFLLIYIYNKY